MKNKKGLIITILIISVVFVICYFSFIKTDNANNSSTPNVQPKLTKNYSMFFTISNCINKYYTYVGKRDKENVIKLLNDDYVKNNKINKNNVFDKITSYGENMVNMKVKKMHEKVLNKKITVYYIYGNVYVENYTDILNKGDAYFEVRIDSSNKLFDITPMNKSSYEEVVNG